MFGKNGFAAVTVALWALAGVAQAADQDIVDSQDAVDSNGETEASVYGNLHLGTYDDTVSSGGSYTSQVYLNGGAKIAIEPVASPFGLQFDAEGNGSSSAWQLGTPINDGSQTDMLAVAHATFAANDTLKFGIFGGYEDVNIDLTNIKDPFYSFQGVNNLSRASSDFTYGSIGAEALYSMSPDNWVQMRAGFIKPLTGDVSATDRTTGLTQTASGDFSDIKGYEVGVGARFGVFQNFSMRADANFISIQIPSGGSTNDINTLVTGQYTFDGSPFSAYAQIGYERAFTDTFATDVIRSRTGITWSFGGPSASTRNKLFRSAGIGGAFN
jgi:hypothetical protein